MLSTRLAVVVAVLALSGAACASRQKADDFDSSAAASASKFPSRDALAALTQNALPSLSRADAVEVDDWGLSGPLPDASNEVALYSDESPWFGALAATANARAATVQLTADMHCVARELGLFQLAKGAAPAEPLKDFILARCGSGVARLRSGWLGGEVDEALGEAELVGHWRADLNRTIEAVLASGQRLAGIWFGRNGRHALVMVVSGERLAQLDPIPMIRPSGGGGRETAVTLSGQVLSPAESVSAIATRGPYGFVDCRADRDVELPHFRIECPVSAADRQVDIDLLVRAPGRLLAQTATMVLALGANNDGRRWERVRVAGGEATRYDPAVLAGLLNDLRTRAGLDPVQLAERQSSVATRLAPYYFAAASGIGSPLAADMIALGLQAGWDVEGIVQSAGFASVLAQGDRTAALLESAFARPGSRSALMNPKVTQLAVGAVAIEGDKAVGAVLATYALFDVADHDRRIAALLDKLTKARLGYGRSAPEKVGKLDGIAAYYAEQVDQGSRQPGALLTPFMRDCVKEMRSGVRGWMLQAGSLEELEFPAEMLKMSRLKVSAAVSVARREGEPWGRYVVLLVAASDGGDT